MAITLDIQLQHYPRGFHLITRDIVSHLPELPENGLLVVLQLYIQGYSHYITAFLLCLQRYFFILLHK